MRTPTAGDGDFEALLREQAWLRAFVQRLVRGDDADDVVQQTWLAALLRPVRAHDARAWLATLASNLARMLHRGDARRRARERTRGEASAPAAADTVAKLELQQRVAAAVCALPEPLRTPLVLHYHDGLSPDAIGARLGLAPAAVRKRLQRGRDQVRATLARELGDDWRSLGCVLAFAQLPAVDASRAPLAARHLRWLGAAALAVATVSVGCIAASANASRELVAASGVSAAANVVSTAPAPRSEAVHDEPAVLQRTALQDPQGDGNQGDAKPFVGVRLRGRCVAKETGAPLAGVTATARVVLPKEQPVPEGFAQPAPQVTGADGVFDFTLVPNAGSFELRLDAPGYVHHRFSFDAETTRPIDLADVAMLRGFSLRGRVVDAQSRPMAGVVLLHEHTENCIETTIEWRETARSRGDGSFEFEQLLPAGVMDISIDKPHGLRIAQPIEVLARVEGTDVVVHAVASPSISGVVFDGQGKPLADIAVGVFEQGPLGRDGLPGHGNIATRSRKDGSFELFTTDSDAADVQLVTGDFSSRAVPELHPTVHWGTHGLQLRASLAPPIDLLVLDELGNSVADHVLRHTWNHNDATMMREPMVDHSDLRRGSRVFFTPGGDNVFTVIPKDPSLAVTCVRLLADQAVPPRMVVRAERLQSFAVNVLREGGRGNAGVEVDVLEMRGGTDVNWFDDWRNGRWVFLAGKPSALRYSTGRTDADGLVTLAAPRSCRDLRVVVRTTPPHIHTLTAFPPAGEPLRITLPSR